MCGKGYCKKDRQFQQGRKNYHGKEIASAANIKTTQSLRK